MKIADAAPGRDRQPPDGPAAEETADAHVDPPGGDRRCRILAAAARLLADGGVNGTTVAGIAREAGVAVGSVYLEFGSKDDIIEALSLGRFERVLTPMRAAAAIGPWPDRLRAMMTRRAHALRALAADGAHGPELLHACCLGAKRAWQAFADAERALIAEVVRGGCDDGAFAPGDLATTADTIRRAYLAFTPPRLLDLDDAALAAGLDAMHRLVLDGLCRRADR